MRGEAASATIPRWKRFFFKAVLFAAVLLAAAGVHALLSAVIYPNLVYHSAQGFINRVLAGEVDHIGGVEVNTQGDIIIRDAQISTQTAGTRRLFYRVQEILLSFDGMPLVDENIRLSRVEFHRPEIFLYKPAGEKWNVEGLFVAPAKRAAPGERFAFPAGGIHVYNGVAHVTVADERGKELTWKLEKVFFSIAGVGEKIDISPIDAEFAKGRARIDLDLAVGDAPSYGIKLHLWDALVEEMTRGTELEARKVRGFLDIVMTMEVSAGETGQAPVGSNYLRIRDGHIWDLPVFLGVLNLLRLDPSLESSFDEVLVHFTIEKDRVRVDDMRFLGYPVSLFGDGSMKLTGEEIDMVFIPRLGKRGLEEIPVVGAPVQFLLDIVKGTLVPIVVRGSFAHPQISVQTGRTITEPVRKLIELFGGGD
ncbi:MAG: hypothetical protein A2Z34_02130 [Planctomycetes bacterium RBG_16_59_8]|nr:MAG: hypothetical protein A2Z34_02130 [Planctomycetes bacterium RBG_16_59_8]